MKKLHDISDESINLEDAGILTIKNIVSKELEKKTRIKKLSGSMAAEDIFVALQIINNLKKERTRKEDNRGEEAERQRSILQMPELLSM